MSTFTPGTPRALLLFISLALALGACSGESTAGAGPQGTSGSQTSDAQSSDNRSSDVQGADAQGAADTAEPKTYAPTDPDGPTRYDKVFGEDQIHDLAITYRPGEWERQQEDMKDKLGEFGSAPAGGGAGPGGPRGGGGLPKLPPPAYKACEGLKQGDACTVQLKNGTATGTCGDAQDGLGCLLKGPSGGGGGGGGGGGAPGGDLVKGDPTWVAVDLVFDGVELPWAGLRYKGNSTLNSGWRGGVHKLPFRVTFDKWEDDHPETLNQRLWGFKKLTFASAAKDNSFLRDVLATEVLRDRGVPAARATFVRVTVDKGLGEGPVYAGLYIAIEDPADEMMKVAFGDNDGNLYKPDGVGAAWRNFDEASFVKKNNEDEADWSDVQSAIAALNGDRSDAAAWRAELEKHVDVQAFLRWLSVNSAMQNWDVYGAMTHNYYLYGDPNQSGRLVWVPWDHNEAFTTGGKGLSDVMHGGVGQQWPLIRFLLDDAVYLAKYKELLAAAVGGAYAEAAFAARVKTLHQLISADVLKEKKPWTNKSSDAAFEASVQQLINHAANRRAAIASALGKGN